MPPENPYPSGRSTASPSAAEPSDVPPEATTIPWIDVHQHTQTLTWNDRHRFDLSGGKAVVMIAGDYYSAPDKPLSPADVTYLWDSALEDAGNFSRCHFHEQYVAIGIHTWSSVDDHGELLDLLPRYCERPEVVAVGETGIESIQHTAGWDLEDQRDAVRGQMHVARETGLPVLLHTPGSSKGGMSPAVAATYEQANENFAEPVFEAEETKLEAVKMDLELADEAGLPQEQIVVDHADESVLPYVFENTDCYASYSVSAPQLRGIDAGDVAASIREHGPDRLLIDTDLIGAMRNDPFAMKETMLDLVRHGIDPADVRRVCYENPREVLGLDLPA